MAHGIVYNDDPFTGGPSNPPPPPPYDPFDSDDDEVDDDLNSLTRFREHGGSNDDGKDANKNEASPGPATPEQTAPIPPIGGFTTPTRNNAAFQDSPVMPVMKRRNRRMFSWCTEAGSPYHVPFQARPMPFLDPDQAGHLLPSFNATEANNGFANNACSVNAFGYDAAIANNTATSNPTGRDEKTSTPAGHGAGDSAHGKSEAIVEKPNKNGAIKATGGGATPTKQAEKDSAPADNRRNDAGVAHGKSRECREGSDTSARKFKKRPAPAGTSHSGDHAHEESRAAAGHRQQRQQQEASPTLDPRRLFPVELPQNFIPEVSWYERMKPAFFNYETDGDLPGEWRYAPPENPSLAEFEGRIEDASELLTLVRDLCRDKLRSYNVGQSCRLEYALDLVGAHLAGVCGHLKEVVSPEEMNPEVLRWVSDVCFCLDEIFATYQGQIGYNKRSRAAIELRLTDLLVLADIDGMQPAKPPPRPPVSQAEIAQELEGLVAEVAAARPLVMGPLGGSYLATSLGPRLEAIENGLRALVIALRQGWVGRGWVLPASAAQHVLSPPPLLVNDAAIATLLGMGPERVREMVRRLRARRVTLGIEPDKAWQVKFPRLQGIERALDSIVRTLF